MLLREALLREHFGRLEGLKIAYVGAWTNVARSLAEAEGVAGMEVVVAAPERAADPRQAVEGAHAVYTDVWVSMGQEADAEQRRSKLAPYRVDTQLMTYARPDAVFLHCLTAHRGEEVVAEVIDGPQSVVWQQAANRMPTEQALLYALVTGDWGDR